MNSATQNVRATNAAAVTNHLSCSRSSPTERRKRMRTEPNDPTTATVRARAATMKATSAKAATEPSLGARRSANGRDQFSVARTIALSGSRTRIPHESQAKGRQRCDGRCPVGNKRNRNGRRHTAIVSTQLESQIDACPPGRDPRSASRA